MNLRAVLADIDFNYGRITVAFQTVKPQNDVRPAEPAMAFTLAWSLAKSSQPSQTTWSSAHNLWQYRPPLGAEAALR
jgi:hypothetical protein